MGGNFDLNTPVYKKAWPADRSSQDWEHGDYIKVPYRFIYPLFDKIATDGGIK